MRYRRREKIEALPWLGHNRVEAKRFLGCIEYDITPDETLVMEDSIGLSVARVGDYLVKDMGGVLTMPRREFEIAYEPVEEDMAEELRCMEEYSRLNGCVYLLPTMIWRPVIEGETPSDDRIVRCLYFKESGISVYLTTTNRQPCDHHPVTMWAHSVKVRLSQLRRDDEVLAIWDYGRNAIIKERRNGHGLQEAKEKAEEVE